MGAQQTKNASNTAKSEESANTPVTCVYLNRVFIELRPTGKEDNLSIFLSAKEESGAKDTRCNFFLAEVNKKGEILSSRIQHYEDIEPILYQSLLALHKAERGIAAVAEGSGIASLPLIRAVRELSTQCKSCISRSDPDAVLKRVPFPIEATVAQHAEHFNRIADTLFEFDGKFRLSKQEVEICEFVDDLEPSVADCSGPVTIQINAAQMAFVPNVDRLKAFVHETVHQHKQAKGSEHMLTVCGSTDQAMSEMPTYFLTPLIYARVYDKTDIMALDGAGLLKILLDSEKKFDGVSDARKLLQEIGAVPGFKSWLSAEAERLKKKDAEHYYTHLGEKLGTAHNILFHAQAQEIDTYGLYMFFGILLLLNNNMDLAKTARQMLESNPEKLEELINSISDADFRRIFHNYRTCLAET